MSETPPSPTPDIPSLNETASYRLPIRRPVTVAMFFLTLLVFGWRSYEELPINLMPDISYPTLTVRTEYEGAAPEDVEKLVTRPVEERLSIVNGVVELSSISSAGLSVAIMEFAWGTDMDVAMQDVRESLDLFDPPNGVTQQPIILRYDPTLDPVMRVALLGRDVSGIADPVEREMQMHADLTILREAAEKQLKSDLEAEPGIAQVRVKGGREEEIQILLDSERLKALNLGPSNVVLALQQQNVNLSGGRLKEGRTEYLVRTLNEFENIEEIRGVVLDSVDGRQVRLEDVARVQFGSKERDTIVRVNGQEVVELEFFKEGDANVVQVSAKLQKFFGFVQTSDPREGFLRLLARLMPTQRNLDALSRLEREKLLADKLRTRLPEFVRPVLITDQARFIQASIREVQRTAMVGGVLALLVLFLFLRELRSTIIIGVAIPISVVSTFVPMFVGDISLNIMSLGGIALGIGMLVDNSIVVLESIFRCREEGDPLLEAAERGTKEVAGAVTASTLTTIAVFFPIVFVEGIAGQLFRDLALTVTFSLLASLSVALLLIPMVASRRGMQFDSEAGAEILADYRAARSRGRSVIAALFTLPAAALRRTGNHIAKGWADTVGACAGGIRHGHWGAKAGYGLLFPLAFVLFLLQVALRMAGLALISMLLTTTVVAGTALVVVSRVVRALLYVPLALFERLFNFSRDAYTVLLRQALRLSPVLLVGVLLLAVHAASLVPGLGRELIPPMKQGEFTIRMEAPPGTRLDETEQRAERIESVIGEFPEVDTVTVQIGTDDAKAGADEGENVAKFSVKLLNPGETALVQDAIIEKMRRAVTAMTPDQVTFTLPTLFSFKTALEVQIFGEDLQQLRELGQAVVAATEGIDGVKDVDLSLKRGYPEVHIVLLREDLAAKGLEPFDVAQRLRTEVQGDIATRFSRAGEKVDIRVRTDQNRLTSIADLKRLSVVDGSPPTPLSSVARIEVQEGPSEIRRIDQRQVAVVSANVEGRDLGSVGFEVQERLDRLRWPSGYTYTLGGQNRELQRSYGGLVFALLLAVFLVYVVMASQFESFWNPFLIMFSVPLAFIGVIYALWWLDIDLSIVVFIGGIVLAGIVVNAAIVLVDYINQLRARGLAKVDAIIEAGTVRFRPIMMTTLTTILGLIPMAISGGEGAEIRGPMAITVMAGLVSATALTLLVVPVMYNLFGGRDRT